MRNCFTFLACGLTILLFSCPAAAQIAAVHPSPLAAAKTIYFEDKSGVDAVGAKALQELAKWGRFQIVRNRSEADLIVLLVRDPHQAGDLILAGGQTGSVDSGGIHEDPVPTFNKAAPVSYAFLQATDARTGNVVWSDSHRWGGLLTGFNSAGERLVKKFEQATQEADQAAQLKIIKSVIPSYPPEAARKGIYGTVDVRITVDKHGAVSDAKAINGPGQLARASEEAAKQFQFKPPAKAPVTATVEMTYNLSPVPCPAGAKAHLATVSWSEKFPISTGHPGELKILDDPYNPAPHYPEEAREAGIEGDVKLFLTVTSTGEVIGARVTDAPNDKLADAALSTVRTWKFKVSHGSDASIPFTISFRLGCDTADLK